MVVTLHLFYILTFFQESIELRRKKCIKTILNIQKWGSNKCWRFWIWHIWWRIKLDDSQRNMIHFITLSKFSECIMENRKFKNKYTTVITFILFHRRKVFHWTCKVIWVKLIFNVNIKTENLRAVTKKYKVECLHSSCVKS